MYTLRLGKVSKQMIIYHYYLYTTNYMHWFVFFKSMWCALFMNYYYNLWLWSVSFQNHNRHHSLQLFISFQPPPSPSILVFPITFFILNQVFRAESCVRVVPFNSIEDDDWFINFAFLSLSHSLSRWTRLPTLSFNLSYNCCQPIC